MRDINDQLSNRRRTFTCHNGDKAENTFPPAEYEARLSKLRRHMADNDIPAVLFTSMTK